MLGFDTIGNATLIIYDDQPLLATDPWIDGAAYFGSWGLSHEIPAPQQEAIYSCPYIWLSHGHPDHINGGSMDMLSNQTFLVADHFGRRIASDLEESGRNVQVLKSKEWVSLTDNVKVMSIADMNQDSILLVQVGDDLVCNLNDCFDRGWGPFVKKIAANFENRFLLRINGYGDATMINYRTESGEHIVPPFIEKNMKTGVGRRMQEAARTFGANFVVPFSSLHRYQRKDSIWANKFVASLDDYKIGFNDPNIVLTEAFVRWDSVAKTLENIPTKQLDHCTFPPEDFGDDWSDTLTPADKKSLDEYIQRHVTLKNDIGFVTFRVGGTDHTVTINPQKKLGFTFETPRGSLMTVARYQIFDDIIIGNFTKTTVHNPPENLVKVPLKMLKYPLLYGGSGRAFTNEELNQYHRYYRQMFPFTALKRALLHNTSQIFRKFAAPDTKLFEAGKRIYHLVR